MERAVAYAEAGADCIFTPGVRDPDIIGAIVRAVAPVPVNVIVSAPGPGLTLANLADLGVRRISVGSALARVAWAAFIHSARELLDGTFDSFAAATPFRDLETMFGGRRAR
jgi:2-methylisocitrate lyase-like PEP mutase family enzyme